MADGKVSQFQHKGIDKRSNKFLREDNYATDCLNTQLTKDGDISKRPGWKTVGDNIGGLGLYVHTLFDEDTGEETQELLALHTDGKLYRANRTSFTIEYAGSGTVTASWHYDSTDDEWSLKVIEDGSTVIDENVGLGRNEGSPTDLATLKTAIDAVTDFSVTIGEEGDDTIPAAFLFPTYEVESIDATTGTLVLYAYSWEEINSVQTTLFSNTIGKIDQSYFESVSSVNINNITYFSSGYDEMVKYDGQRNYRAGMPVLTAPLLAETAASGTAEVTEITCIADTSLAAIYQIEFDDSDNDWSNDSTDRDQKIHLFIKDGNNDWVKFYPQVGSIIWTGSSHSYDRQIKYSMSDHVPNTTAAAAFETAADADSYFSASRSGDIVTLTDASTGSRDNFVLQWDSGPPSAGDNLNVSLLQAGTDGLDGKYFIFNDTPSTTVAFWIDIDNSGTAEPAHGADRATEITTISASDTASAVASAIQAVIDADSAFSASVVSNVVTVTHASAGAVPDASSGTSGFAINVTTQGTNSGIGQNEFTYHLTAEHVDDTGLITEGKYSDDISIDLSASTVNPVLTIYTIQSDSGFNTGCAIVNGAQPNVNTITVDAGHTLLAGDKAFFKGQSQGAVAEITDIQCVADVSGSLDGAYFILYGGGTEAATAFWIDVDDSGTSEPSHGAPNSVEITTISTNDTANDVASAIATIINAESEWSASASTDTITVTDAFKGARTDAFDGDTATSFVFSVTTEGSNARPGENVLRNIDSVTSTTITIDGDPVTVSDNDVISAGLRINIWRTEADGNANIKFLVDTIPNNSFAESVTYEDELLDADLGAAWVEPEFDHDLPQKGKYITAWNKVLFVGGATDEESTIYYSIPGETSPEYMPIATNSLLINSPFGDGIRGLSPVGNSLAIFKDRSLFELGGDIFYGNIRVDQVLKRSFNFASHGSLVDVDTTVFFTDKTGIYSISIQSGLKEESSIIKPFFTRDQNFSDGEYQFRKARSFHFRADEQTWFFIPVIATNETTELTYATTESRAYVYDWFHDSWYKWDNIDFTGGIVELNGDIFFTEWCVDSNGDRTHYLNRINKEETKSYKYINHDTAISANWKTNWYDLDKPSSFKKFTKLRAHTETDINSSTNETISITTELDYVENTTDSSFSLTPDGTTIKKQRLKPTKARSLRLIFANAISNQNMLISGWELDTTVLEAESIKE